MAGDEGKEKNVQKCKKIHGWCHWEGNASALRASTKRHLTWCGPFSPLHHPPASPHLHQKSITRKLWKWNTICTLFAVEKKILMKQWKIYLFRLMRGAGDVIRQKRLITLPRISHSKRFSEATKTQFLPIVCNTNFWSRWKKGKSLFSMHRELPILPYSFFPPRDL